MQMRIHLIKEGISAQARNRAERVDRARGNISRRRRTRGKRGSPFTPFPCEVLFIFRPISNYQDERAGERTEKRTTERESRRQRRKGGGIRGGGRGACVIGIHLSGSHVLSQFALLPRPSLRPLSPRTLLSPFFAPLHRPVARTGPGPGPAPLRGFPPPPLPATSCPSRWRPRPPRIFLRREESVHEDARASAESPSRVKRPTSRRPRGLRAGPDPAPSRRRSLWTLSTGRYGGHNAEALR